MIWLWIVDRLILKRLRRLDLEFERGCDGKDSKEATISRAVMDVGGSAFALNSPVENCLSPWLVEC